MRLGYHNSMYLFSKKPGVKKRSLSVLVLWVLLCGTAAAGDHGTAKPHHAGATREQDVMEKDRLTEDQGKFLLKVARQTIEQELFARKGQAVGEENLPAVFQKRRGTFVTLTEKGNLRGCIGHIIPQETLIEGVRENAINAAFRDPRFHPLRAEEWKDVKIEVSILTDPKPLSYSDGQDLLKKLRPGIDGIIIKKGYHQATFLPQVWDQLPDQKEFLTHLCYKAGLDGDAWKSGDLEVSTYQVQAFEE
jgi:AmmeMemoRadiSam system protein A